MKFGKITKYGNVLFCAQQGTTYENGHEIMISYVVLWCLPNKKFQKKSEDRVLRAPGARKHGGGPPLWCVSVKGEGEGMYINKE